MVIDGSNNENFFKQGIDYYNENKFTEAVSLFQKAAELGHVKSMIRLGEWYDEQAVYQLSGNIDAFYEKARYWFTKAAETGNADAMYRAGMAAGKGKLMEENDWITRDYWVLQAAEAGHIDAMVSVASRYESGKLYIDGERVGPDEQKSAFWYEKAAKKGHIGGMHSAWQNYSLGSGVQKDMEKAVYWLKKSAECGNSISQMVLGDMCYNGEWFERDKAKAAYWYERAAKNVMRAEYLFDDEYEMIKKLSRMYSVGDGILQDSKRAEDLNRYLEVRGSGILW